MTTRELVSQYVEVLCKIYGKHLENSYSVWFLCKGHYTKARIEILWVLLIK